MTKASTRRTRPKPTAKAGTGRRKRSRAEQTEATKQRILGAALELFEAKGFAATTTKAIARRAGIAEGTVFNYFETKDDLALYFFEREVDNAIESVRNNARLRKAPLEERLFALIQYQLDYLAPHERFLWAAIARAMQPSSSLALGARAVALRARYLAFVEELIADATPARQPNAYGWVVPHVFWAFYLGVILFWMSDTSDGKQRTLAFVDRALSFGVSALRQGRL